MNQQDKKAIVLCYLAMFLGKNKLKNSKAKNLWENIGYWRDLMKLQILCEKEIFDIEILKKRAEEIHCEMNGLFYQINQIQLLKHKVSCHIQSKQKQEYFECYYSIDKLKHEWISYKGKAYAIKNNQVLEAEEVHRKIVSEGDNQNMLHSPMPGKVLKINVKQSDKVSKGDMIMIVEAMKMENHILSPKDCFVKNIFTKVGENVDIDKPLAELSDTNI